MIESFALRNLIEVTQRWASITERQREGYSFIGSRGFDIGELPILDLKAYSGARDPDDIDLAMAHCTAVTQGFGVQKYGPTGTLHWRKQLITGAVERDAPNLYEAMDRCGMLLRPDEAVHFLALASRYRNTTYHVIGSQAGYLFRNRPPEQSSHHGQGTRRSGGNKGLGFAFDCSPSTNLTDRLISTFRATVRLVHLVWHKYQSEHGPHLRVVSHAQAKWPGRAMDPGPALWQRVVVPEVQQLRDEGHDIVIDLQWTYGTGRVPDWMKAA